MAQDVVPIINLEEQEPKLDLGRRFLAEGSDRNSPISVEEYPNVFILDHEMTTTSTPLVTSPGDVIDLDDGSDGDGDVVVLEGWKGKVPLSRFSRKLRSRTRSLRSVPLPGLSVIEIGESSGCSAELPTPTVFCAICMESKLLSESFGMSCCSHVFCIDCIKQYIAAKIQDNVTKICCPDPDCKDGFLEPERCHPILPPEVFERWCSTLCESLLLNSTRLYCPFKDCSAPLLNEVDGGASLDIVIRESSCPHCWRLFCAQCKVPWHMGFTCEAFQKLSVDERGQEDMMLLNMAKNKKWQRCPKCKIFVERTEGCMFMKCRCGYTFCYGCGTEMTVDHYCRQCKR